jgi:precorrin-6A/cobalt-precorrin-6A reductase
MATPHILILGGTGDARLLAARLVQSGHYRVTLSLAGRTKTPIPHACEVRTGGFGGVDGLIRELRERKIDLMVDATHPFAARISANAFAASAAGNVALIALDRPAWQRVENDNWDEVDSMADAAIALDSAPKSVFLSIGRQEVGAFAVKPQHRYIVRSIEPVDAQSMLPGAIAVLDRGPFDLARERDLLQQHGIEIIVTKNSGGNATYAKIVAARELGLPVIMVRRPKPSGAATEQTLDGLEARITAHFSIAPNRPVDSGE